MARDKLITIRIEGEKRDLFNQLAKSQNTDTASLLYDFISGCLDGRIDISLVTGKGNRLDNQIDTNRIDNRLDKLETATQRLDERLGIITKKLNDWIEDFDDRLNDSDQGLSEKIISLEHRLNALSIRLDTQGDSQQDRQEIDNRIDTDSQQDSQRIDDMEHLLKREKECSIASPIPTGETSPLPPSYPGEGGNANTPDLPPLPPDRPATAIETSTLPPSPDVIDGTGDAIESLKVETADNVEAAIETDSTIETGPGAIENENRETSPMNDAGEGAIDLTNKEKAAILGIHASNLTKWVKKGEITDKYLDKCRFNDDKTKIILI